MELNQEPWLLPAQMTVDRAEELKSLLQHWMTQEGSTFVCIGSHVECLDASGLQLLLAANMCLQQEGRSLIIRESSPRLQEVLRLSGTEQLFNLEVG